MTFVGSQGFPLTCRSCSHSQHRPNGPERHVGRLWCGMRQAIALHRCGDFEFEPGTDEGDWKR